MDSLNAAIERSVWFAERVRRRTDIHLRAKVAGYDRPLSFQPIESLLISLHAWRHIRAASIPPKLVFAHPDLLVDIPETSAYYRNMALLPQKRVSDLAANVKTWEEGTRRNPISNEVALGVSKLYNAVLSSIIEGSTEWTLDNGYRNIVASMGVGLDGTMRNVIGRDADIQVKSRLLTWLQGQGLVLRGDAYKGGIQLRGECWMVFGSEPDIAFFRDGVLISTIEIKGGRDPAGALERLGAARKSFEATPPGCVNILVAGVMTGEMRRRLGLLGNVKTFNLDDLTFDGDGWYEFLDEVFHHTVRIVDSEVKSPVLDGPK